MYIYRYMHTKLAHTSPKDVLSMFASPSKSRVRKNAHYSFASSHVRLHPHRMFAASVLDLALVLVKLAVP